MGFAEVPNDDVSHQDSVPCYPLGRNHRWALRRYLAMTCRIRIRCLVTHSEGITDGLRGEDTVGAALTADELMGGGGADGGAAPIVPPPRGSLPFAFHRVDPKSTRLVFQQNLALWRRDDLAASLAPFGRVRRPSVCLVVCPRRRPPRARRSLVVGRARVHARDAHDARWNPRRSSRASLALRRGSDLSSPLARRSRRIPVPTSHRATLSALATLRPRAGGFARRRREVGWKNTTRGAFKDTGSPHHWEQGWDCKPADTPRTPRTVTAACGGGGGGDGAIIAAANSPIDRRDRASAAARSVARALIVNYTAADGLMWIEDLGHRGARQRAARARVGLW